MLKPLALEEDNSLKAFQIGTASMKSSGSGSELDPDAAFFNLVDLSSTPSFSKPFKNDEFLFVVGCFFKTNST